MTDEQKARIEYDHITLRHDRQEKERFEKAWNGYKTRTGDKPTQGKFLMILLDQWERRKEEV